MAPRVSLGLRFVLLEAAMVGVPTLACAVVLFQVHRIRQDADRLREETRESAVANRLLVRVEALAAALGGPLAAARQSPEAEMAEVRRLAAELADAGDHDPSREEHQDTESGLLRAIETGLAAVEVRLAQANAPAAEPPPALEAAYRAAAVLAEETQRESHDLEIDIDRRGRSTRQLVVASVATVALVAGAGLFLVFRTLLGPIRLLRAGALSLRRGDLTHRIDVGRNDEVGDLGRAFNAMADELGRSHAELERKVETRTRELIHAARLADVGVLAAGVAHEVNNPLASIASCGEALLRRIDQGTLEPAEARDYAETIVSEAYRTRDITGRLLNLARADSGQVDAIDTERLFAQAVQITKHLLKEKALELELDLAGGLDPLHGNAGELLQVLLNLILNARDASPPGGAIHLGARQEDGSQTWEVRDHGAGLAPELRERVFDPFFTTKDPGAGTGLGLSLAAAIVDRHGGTIEAADAPGGGARFVVRLPLGSAVA